LVSFSIAFFFFANYFFLSIDFVMSKNAWLSFYGDASCNSFDVKF